MDDQRHAAAVTDEAVGDEIARALAVDPSPEFLARVRAQIANEPHPRIWRMSWMLSTFALVAAVVFAVTIDRRAGVPALVTAPLASRAVGGHPTMLPYVASAFRRTSSSPAQAGRHVRIDSLEGPAEAGPHVQVLFDPRETQALRALIAGVRTNRVDLSSLLRPGAPGPMELPPVDDLVIAPLAIEPLAPIAGAQGERQ
jgi:hypothetical protein